MGRSQGATAPCGLVAQLVVVVVLLLTPVISMLAATAATTRAPSLAAGSRSLCAVRAARSSLLRAPSAHGQLHKSLPCALWSSSFSFCLAGIRRSTSPSSAGFCFSATPHISMAAAAAKPAPASASGEEPLDSNPLLQDFAFPPFDVVQAKDVVPGIRKLLGILVRSLASPLLLLSLSPARRSGVPPSCVAVIGRYLI